MTSGGPVPVQFARLATEESLESMIVKDPTVLGSDLMFIGRQVKTDYGGYVDVLAVDADGHVHVLELKRDRTPREVVAQVIDYGSWAKDLTLDQVTAIFALQHDIEFEDAFAEHFAAPVPDVFNADQQLTVVAAALDPASDRIITYLAQRYSVPINAVFFRYFADGDSHFLARTWLMAQEQAETRKTGPTTTSKVRPWNGRDFYCILGTLENHSERWNVGRRYGFVGAGGGAWYWKTAQPQRGKARPCVRRWCGLRRNRGGHRADGSPPGPGGVGRRLCRASRRPARDTSLDDRARPLTRR